jgi:Outer membrane protein beta-barrel domain
MSHPRFPLLMAVAVVTSALLLPTEADAQQHERIRVSGSIFGASGGDSDGTLGAIASAGYMFDPRLGFELEVAWLRELEFEFDGVRILTLPQEVSPQIFPPIDVHQTASVILLNSNLVVEFPTRGRRLRPYALAGGGIASVERVIGTRFDPLGNLPIGVPLPPNLPIPIPRFSRSEQTEAALTLNAGAGLDVRVWEGLWIAADARYAHIFTDDDIDVVRAGARVSYRF